MDISVDQFWHEMLLEQDGKLTFTDMCRLCGSSSLDLISLYGDEDLENDLRSKIDLYLPIQLSESDSLPHKVCSHCASTLVSWHELNINCVKIDEKLREILQNVSVQPNGEFEHFDENVTCLIENEANLNTSLVCEGNAKLKNGKVPAASVTPMDDEVQRFQAEQCQMLTDSNNQTGKDRMHSSPLVDGEQLTIKPNRDVAESILLRHPDVTYDPVCKTAEVKYYSLILDKPLCHEKVPNKFPQQIQNVETKSIVDNLLHDSQHSCNGISTIDETVCVFNESSSDTSFLLSLDHNYVLPESNSSAYGNDCINQQESQKLQPEQKNLQPVQLQELLLSHPDQQDLQLLLLEPKHLQLSNKQFSHLPQPGPQHLQLLSKQPHLLLQLDQQVEQQEKQTLEQKQKNFGRPFRTSKRAFFFRSKPYEVKIVKMLEDKVVCKVKRRWHGNKRVVTCNYCSQNFKNLYVLQTHTRFHAGIMPFYCKNCGKTFYLSSSLRQHLGNCSGVIYSSDSGEEEDFETTSAEMIKGFSCDICGKKCMLKASLREHLKHHEGKARMKQKCECCGARFYKKAELMEHAKSHDATVLSTCEICGKLFLNNKDLQEHQISHSNDRPFPCEICGMSYKRKSHLTRHLLVHAKTNRCISKHRLNSRKLPGEVLICEKCGKMCRTRYLLSLHMVCHTGERKHVCYSCGKRFAQSGALRRHLHTVHVGAKDFRCEVCDRCFTAKATKDSHMRIHTGEKPYQCPHCGKTFRTNQQYKLHEKIHSDERPFSCEYCEKSFRRRPHLIVHIRTHTGEKPYGCSVCGRGFAQKNDMNKHMKTHT